MKQAAAKQALAIVKSQRKKKKKTKPEFKSLTMELDSRFIEITQDVNSFDLWIKLTSIGNKIKLFLPSKKHKHFNKFIKDGWNIKKSLRIRMTDKGFFIDLYLEKAEPPQKAFGRTIGVDIGYKKLIVDSKGKKYGSDFSLVAEKISRKKQGSESFKKALIERNNFVNQSLNNFNLKGVKTLSIENLKSVKHESKGKIRKSFNNKLQRWTYPQIINKLSRACEEAGVRLIRIDPAYTSQTCNCCKVRDKSARNGEIFKCDNPKCKNHQKKIDADWNAAMNIKSKGRLQLSAEAYIISQAIL
jgi:putative transposase